MRHRIGLGIAVWVLVGGGPARAQEDGFCGTLSKAWSVARSDPKALGDQRIAGATVCTRFEGSLQCSWLLGTKENGRTTFERFKSEAAACLAPQGLTPTATNVAGSETSLLEGPGDTPAVAIIYPGNASVSVFITLPE